MLWARLTDVATQVEWHGMKLNTNDWKLLFLDALNRETILVPAIDGDGHVQLGRSSSDLSKQEMSELIDLIAAFGANHNVTFNDPTETAGNEPGFRGEDHPGQSDSPRTNSEMAGNEPRLREGGGNLDPATVSLPPHNSEAGA